MHIYTKSIADHNCNNFSSLILHTENQSLKATNLILMNLNNTKDLFSWDSKQILDNTHCSFLYINSKINQNK